MSQIAAGQQFSKAILNLQQSLKKTRFLEALLKPRRKFEYEFVNGRRVLSAKDNNGSKSWNLYIQSSKGITADAWKYAIKWV